MREWREQSQSVALDRHRSLFLQSSSPACHKRALRLNPNSKLNPMKLSGLRASAGGGPFVTFTGDCPMRRRLEDRPQKRGRQSSSFFESKREAGAKTINIFV